MEASIQKNMDPRSFCHEEFCPPTALDFCFGRLGTLEKTMVSVALGTTGILVPISPNPASDLCADFIFFLS